MTSETSIASIAKDPEMVYEWFLRDNIPIQELTEMWLALDQNESTRTEIQALMSKDDTLELEKRMRNWINFGTAGLRGRMEAGFSRMNDLTVIQASQGLAEYVLKQVPDAKIRGVVLGRDHRYHSETFMRLAAAAFLSRGFKVYWFRGFLNHTPLVPYGVQKQGAACGVMITASHNPARDNGYKVYWENGCQILSPHDAGIQNSIMQHLVPESCDTKMVEAHPLSRDVTDELFLGYIQDVTKLASSTLSSQTKFPPFVYTPMHGVGLNIFQKVIATIGLEKYMHAVPEQSHPDPEFPTVIYPNPEENGALDMAIAFANKLDSPLVLANDPDADRFCAAERSISGDWHIFSGNELGIILAHQVLNQYKSQPNFDLSRLAMLSSAVSSKMIRSMAQKERFHHEETLTGFKYMANKALELQGQGYEAPYAFEEAIGYMFSDIVRDKDGIAAAALFLRIVAKVYNEGQTILELLNELYERYGYFASRNSYFRCEDPTLMIRAFHALRHTDGQLSYIRQFGSYDVVRIKDISLGYDSQKDGLPQDKAVSPSSEMITFELKNGVVMTLRGSGTEPKLKYYIEAKATSALEAEKRAEDVEEALKIVVEGVGM